MGRATVRQAKLKSSRRGGNLKAGGFDFVAESGLDERNRISLSKVLPALKKSLPPKSALRFMLYVNQTGQILLEPSVSIPLREAWLYKSPKALAKVREGLAQLGKYQPRSLGSFARFVKDDLD
jgi:hypothetical protein